MADLGGETSTFTNPNLNCTVEGLVQTRIDQSKERESNTRLVILVVTEEI